MAKGGTRHPGLGEASQPAVGASQPKGRAVGGEPARREIGGGGGEEVPDDAELICRPVEPNPTLAHEVRGHNNRAIGA